MGAMKLHRTEGDTQITGNRFIELVAHHSGEYPGFAWREAAVESPHSAGGGPAQLLVCRLALSVGHVEH